MVVHHWSGDGMVMYHRRSLYNTHKLAQPNNWFFPAPCPHPRYNLKSHCYNFSVGVFGSFCPVWVIECGRVVLVVLGRVVGSKRGWEGADGFKPESAILRVLDSFGTLRGGGGEGSQIECESQAH